MYQACLILYFCENLESLDRKGLISLIKSVYEMRGKRASEGKRNYLVDEGLMQKAEHILYSEISLVLGIPKESVPDFIREQNAGK